MIKQDGKPHQRTSQEKHVGIFREPGSQYFDHATRGGYRAKDIADEIFKS